MKGQQQLRFRVLKEISQLFVLKGSTEVVNVAMRFHIPLLFILAHCLHTCATTSPLQVSELLAIIKEEPLSASTFAVWLSSKSSTYFGANLIKEASKTGSIQALVVHDLLQTDMRLPVVALVQSPDDLEMIREMLQKKPFGERLPLLILIQGFNVSSRNEAVVSKINQEIYVVNMATRVLSETYEVNGKVVETRLGIYSLLGSHSSRITLVQDKSSLSKTFVERRLDFQGQHLVAMTEDWAPYVGLHPAYETEATLFPSNDTLDVTHFATGQYVDILRLLAQKLNFSFSLYKRTDGGWGTVIGKSPTGMFVLFCF